MIRTLFVLFFSICVCHADTVDKHTQQTSEYGDEGKFGGGDPGNTNALILWPHDSPSIVRRHRPGGHSETAPKAVKLWSERGGSGGFPVNLKNEGGFCSFLNKIDSDPDLFACICDDTGAWATGTPFSCTPALTLTQCFPSSCFAGTAPVTPPPGDSCTVSDWSPGTDTVCAGDTFDQTRTLADCSIETRNVSGTGPCADCETSWRPDPADVCDTVQFYQRRTGPGCQDERRLTRGAKNCSQQCNPHDWLPPANTICDTETVEQTFVYGDCSERSRIVTGTRNCQNQCTPTGWSPAAGTECRGNSFTQSRTLADCTTETQKATGTKFCSSTCPATGWSPSADSICQGNSFTQSRTLSDCTTDTRIMTGTQNCQSCTVQDWTPGTSSVCSGDTFTQSRRNADCSTDTRTATGTRHCPTVCRTTSWSPSQSSRCSNDGFTQQRTLSDCSIETREVYGTRQCTPETCRYTTGSWTPSAAGRCTTDRVPQTRTVTAVNQPCAGGTRPSASQTVYGSRDCSLPTCRWTTGPWSPSAAGRCTTETVSQSRTVTLVNSNCEGGTRPSSSQTVSGTRTCNPPCSYSTGSWSPSASNYCDDETFTQTRTVTSSPANCVPGNAPASSQRVSGTKDCGDRVEPPEPPQPPPTATCPAGTIPCSRACGTGSIGCARITFGPGDERAQCSCY